MMIIAISTVFLFLISGLSFIAYRSEPEKSISSGDNSGNIPITNSLIPPIKNRPSNFVFANISVGLWPMGVAYDSSNGYIYVANSNSNTVSVISTSLQVTKIYAVTFMESGLPLGRFWSVTLNGAIYNSTTDTKIFLVPNGTYSYTIGSVPGYSASPSFGNITVNGANVTQAITFRPTTTTLPSSYTIIAIVLIAAVIGAVIAMRRRKQ